MTSLSPSPATRSCEHCTRPFLPPPSAPHKRFCQEGCRNAWHSGRRKAGLELLQRAGEAGDGTGENDKNQPPQPSRGFPILPLSTARQNARNDEK